jgi:hypothetical protein
VREMKRENSFSANLSLGIITKTKTNIKSLIQSHHNFLVPTQSQSNKRAPYRKNVECQRPTFVLAGSESFFETLKTKEVT